jgi:hypothetical protein
MTVGAQVTNIQLRKAPSKSDMRARYIGATLAAAACILFAPAAAAELAFAAFTNRHSAHSVPGNSM